MPSSAQILAELARAAETLQALAVAWHVVFVGIALALAAKWRPPERVAGSVLAFACASVAASMAFVASVFDALVFTALAVVLAALSVRAEKPAVMRFSAAGAVALALGLFYPHFRGAPLGVVPCATLYALTGASLVGFAPQGAFRIVVAVAALFFGAFGVFRLGVIVDLGLVAVALVLLAHEAISFRTQRVHAPVRARSVHS